MQNQNAMPTAAGPVAGAKLTGKEARKAEWLEAQLSTTESQRPQDQYKWEIDNSSTPFKGLLTHWRHYIMVRHLALLLTFQIDCCARPYLVDTASRDSIARGFLQITRRTSQTFFMPSKYCAYCPQQWEEVVVQARIEMSICI